MTQLLGSRLFMLTLGIGPVLLLPPFLSVVVTCRHTQTHYAQM